MSSTSTRSRSCPTAIFSPQGHDGRVLMWDVNDPAHPVRLGHPLVGHRAEVTEVAFAPRGRMLATSSIDGTVLLWDMSHPSAPRRLGHPLTGHHPSVEALAFSPDGSLPATGGSDNMARLWDLRGLNEAREHPLDAACGIADTGLSPAEWARYIPGLSHQDTCAD
ncbi:MAG: WD40 repeat domain-containing protein [Pseudonocardiaceae bacterium]